MNPFLAILNSILCRHQYQWPQDGIETCNRCGGTRPSKINFFPAPRFDVPRWKPSPVIGEKREPERVVEIKRTKKGRS